MNHEGFLTGPVAVTGAEGHVGKALRERLADRPNWVKPLGRGDDWAGEIRNAEAVVHLAGTLQPIRPNSYQVANVGTAERALAALDRNSVQRIVFLSYVGADPASTNEYLRTKGQAEELLGSSGVPSVVFRSTFIYGDRDAIGPSFASYQSRAGETVSVLGNGNQLVAPIHVHDLTALLAAAALDPAGPTGTFEVSGPETFTLDDFIRSINPDGVKIRHLAPRAARILGRVAPKLTPALVDVLLADSVTRTDPTETAALFGVGLRRFGKAAG